jgi:hypothetical protein
MKAALPLVAAAMASVSVLGRAVESDRVSDRISVRDEAERLRADLYWRHCLALPVKTAPNEYEKHLSSVEMDVLYVTAFACAPFDERFRRWPQREDVVRRWIAKVNNEPEQALLKRLSPPSEARTEAMRWFVYLTFESTSCRRVREESATYGRDTPGMSRTCSRLEELRRSRRQEVRRNQQ